VPYEVMPAMQLSSKGKSPWIEYDGEVVEDSSLVVDFLQSKPELHIDLDAHLS
jgi:hypothetical protein